jgi:HEAT repeat protein
MNEPNPNLAVLAGAATLAGEAQPPSETAPPATKEEVEKRIAVLKATQKRKVDALRQLAVMGTPDTIPVLVALLADESLSHMARYALEAMPFPEVDDAFRDALGRLKGKPLIGVIGSLGARKDAKAGGPLAGFLGDADPDVAATAARSLGKIGTGEAASALKGKLGASPQAVRLAVADGCLGCAEKLLAAGAKADAAALYEAVAKADLPEYVRKAAQAAAASAK